MEATHEREVKKMREKLDDGVAKVASIQKKLEEAVSQSAQLTIKKKELSEVTHSFLILFNFICWVLIISAAKT